MDDMSKKKGPENQPEKDTGQENIQQPDTMTTTDQQAEEKGNRKTGKAVGKPYIDNFKKDVEARPNFYKKVGLTAAAILAVIICLAIAMSGGQGGKKASSLSADMKAAAVNESSAYYALGGIGVALQRMGCTDINQAKELLKTGEADAMVMSKDEAQNLSGSYKVLDECLDYNTYAVACALNDDILPTLLNHAFTQIG